MWVSRTIAYVPKISWKIVASMQWVIWFKCLAIMDKSLPIIGWKCMIFLSVHLIYAFVDFCLTCTNCPNNEKKFIHPCHSFIFLLTVKSVLWCWINQSRKWVKTELYLFTFISILIVLSVAIMKKSPYFVPSYFPFIFNLSVLCCW